MQTGTLVEEMKQISLRTWHALGLRGYARCDFRVDARNKPWLLEVNTNPCISQDSGFIASANRARLSPGDVVRRIMQDTLIGVKRPIDFGYENQLRLSNNPP